MENTGRYIYGIAESEREISLGPIGIEGNDVYTISFENLCAIVQQCPAEPYKSGEAVTVQKWVKAHQSVLDEARKIIDTVVPMGFDTILKSENPEQTVKDWLKQDYARLRSVLEKIRGKNEYSVQICYDPEIIARQIIKENQAIGKIKEELDSKQPGTAYLYRQKIEKEVKFELERLAGERFSDFYMRIKNHCDNILIEKNRKKERNKVMLLNLSCLVTRDKVNYLGEELEIINKTVGYSVHFSGPWPPYSFVDKPLKEAA